MYQRLIYEILNKCLHDYIKVDLKWDRSEQIMLLKIMVLLAPDVCVSDHSCTESPL